MPEQNHCMAFKILYSQSIIAILKLVTLPNDTFPSKSLQI